RERLRRLVGAAALAIVPAAVRPQTAPLLFVSNEGSHDVSIIDTRANVVVATISLAGRARGIHVGPDRRHLYVAVSDDKPQTTGTADAIAVIDILARKVVTTYRAGSDPEQFAVTPDGSRLYASN